MVLKGKSLYIYKNQINANITIDGDSRISLQPWFGSNRWYAWCTNPNGAQIKILLDPGEFKLLFPSSWNSKSNPNNRILVEIKDS